MQLNWPLPIEFPTLAEEAVHVWAVPLESSRDVAAGSDDLLSTEERARAASFAVEKSRFTFVASRVALRSLLGRYLDESPREVVIASDPNGKPRLTSGDLRFNLAHSADLTLIAVTRGCEIGVDVELVRPVERSLEIASRNFHPAELATIRAATAIELPEVFLRCWTRKEAVLKAVGAGLAYPLDAFNALVQREQVQEVCLPAHASHPAVAIWLADVHPNREYIAAVATLEPRRPPQGFTYSL